ncbi:MAG: pseudouridine synthase [Actinomycetota bacterium]
MEPAPGVDRLHKTLARAGIGSRRAVEDLIRAGRVKVNGRPAALGQRIDPVKDSVEVDGSRIPLDAALAYYILHKPAGVITTSRDPRGRRTVLDLLDVAERVYPVGRLDAATEGLLILTNDGELAHRLAHPSFEIPKTYLARVSGVPDRSATRRLVQEGVDIGDAGRPLGTPSGRRGSRTQEVLARADRVRILAPRGSWKEGLLEITVHEGRSHMVRRMLAALGHPVRRLVRTSVGPLKLGRLAPGSYRRLTPSEVVSLYRAARL